MSSPGKSKDSGTTGKEAMPFTARGREVTSKFFTNSGAKSIPPVEGRQRANSLRRLDLPRLEALAETHSESPVGMAASREIAVRQELVQHSQQQFPVDAQPKMASKGPITMKEASAIRFAASMAEEAQDEIHAASHGKKEQLGLIGVANVGGTLDVGFSGRKEQEPFIDQVQGRMLELQQFYDQHNASYDWSHHLAPVAVPEIRDVDTKICAASRANLAARSARGEFGHVPNVGRAELPTPDTLVEMQSRSTHPTGERLKNYEVIPPPGDYLKSYQATSMARRVRSGSVFNMMHSCESCMEERLQHAQHSE